MSNKELLKTQGYVVCPSILNAEEVQKARSIIAKLFDEKSNLEGNLNRTSEEGGSVYVDIFSRYKELQWILFNNKFISALSSTLGEDFIILPDMAMHDSQYGGWHKDTTSQEKHKHKWHYDVDFNVVTTAIYLQDNTPQYGGGLDVIPGSHKETKDIFAEQPTLLNRVKNKLLNKSNLKESNFHNKYTIPSKAGDMVIFNLRLTHKATHPTVKPVPESNRKFSIFTICSANNKHARLFTDYIANREDYLFLKNHKYPSELIEEARKINVNLMEVKK
jgi:hypothetical protein